MLARSAALLLGVLFFALPVFAGDHDADSVRTASVGRDAGVGSLQALKRLNEMIELFDEMKRNGTPFADPSLEETVRLLAKRFMEAEDANSLLPGTKMAPADQTVFFNNLELLYEYAVEIMSLQAADNLTSPAELKKLAGDNISKKWRILGRKRRQSWTVADGQDPLLGQFGLQEAARRELLVAQGNDVVFDRFVADLSLSLKGEFGPGAPAAPPAKNTSVIDSLITDINKAKGSGGQQVLKDYEALRKAYQSYVDENIKGKSGEQIGSEVWAEAKRRSAELRQLEATIKNNYGDLPGDLQLAINRFRQDPKHFLDTEYQSFLVQLRARDPQKADDLERLVRDYERHTKDLDALVKKYKGKTAEQIGQEGLDALRKESASVRQFEKDLNSALTQIDQQSKKIKAEVEQKGDELRRRLDGQLKDFKNNDLRRIEGDLKGKIEDSKDTLQRDLRDLGRIFGK